MFAATIETLPRVGEGTLKDLMAKIGNEALASSRMRAAHVAMKRKGKAFGLAGVMLVDRNLVVCEYECGIETCGQLRLPLMTQKPAV